MLLLYSESCRVLEKSFYRDSERNIYQILGAFSRGLKCILRSPPDPLFIFIKGLGEVLFGSMPMPTPYPQLYPHFVILF